MLDEQLPRLCVFRVKTCCGFVYRGHYGDTLIDTGLFHRCHSHDNRLRDNHVTATATVAESVDSGNDNEEYFEEEDLNDENIDDVSPASSSYLADDTEDAASDDRF